MGVITTEELRERALAYRPPTQPPAPVVSKIYSVSAQTQPPKRKRQEQENSPPILDENQRFNKKQKQTRPNKPPAERCNLREIVRNPTRQRFFAECQNPASVLWQPSPSGTKVLCKLLFDRAAVDPINKVYQQHPGPTRGVQFETIKKEVKWQVYKDRQNWNGREPKRPLMFGPVSPFDFQGNLIAVQNAQPMTIVKQEQAPRIKTESEQVSRIKTKSEQAAAAVTAPAQKPPAAPAAQQQPASTILDLDFLKQCVTCGIAVWTGLEKDVPRGVTLACPPESDWTDNAEPYCSGCWDDEDEFLDGLLDNYKAIGGKTAETKQKEAAAKKAATQTQNGKNKTTKGSRRKTKKTTTKRKKLGGVQGQMVHATSTGAADAGRRFSKGESVNARYSDNKYYGAFICKVNDDGTYNLYFFEEWDKKPLLFNVAEKHIKKQLQCKGSKRYKSWHKYVGKTFFDDSNLRLRTLVSSRT